MEKFNKFCDKAAAYLLYLIGAGCIVLIMYGAYRYDVNVVKQGIHEVEQENKH